MNGVSVSPGQNLQNAPTWQVENTARKRAIFANFNHPTPPDTKSFNATRLTLWSTCRYCTSNINSDLPSMGNTDTLHSTFTTYFHFTY